MVVERILLRYTQIGITAMPATSAKKATEKEDYSLIRLSPRLPYKGKLSIKEIDRAVKIVIAERKERELRQAESAR